MQNYHNLNLLAFFTTLFSAIGLKPAQGQPVNTDKPNVLFIMTDQQRFDAMRCVQDELSAYNGKLKIRTPNLDRLSTEGAYFRNAYTHCAVCAPSRATLRTGLTIEGHGGQSNGLVKEDTYTRTPRLFQDKLENAETIDQILVEDRGYVSEYFGKWHLPVIFGDTRDGTGRVIRYNSYNFETGQHEFAGWEKSWGRLYKEYLDYYNRQDSISKTFPEGTQENTFSNYPYYPVQYDIRYGYPTNTPLTNPPFESTSQPHVMGLDELTEKYTPSGMNGFIGVQSLSRLVKEDDPFFLTLSFHNPHAPMVAAEKYFNYYFENREDLFIPPSIIDNGTNTGYGVSNYKDPDKVREWMACYYALVEEVDNWVGVLLDTLDAHPDVRDNTIIIFTSDHGEMLGAHGLNEKNKFLEESAHIPLLIKAPGKITPGTIVEEDVNLLDLFSTVLDYANASSYDNSHGTSMRRFIENKSYNKAYDESHIVTEWDFRDPDGSSLTRSLGGEVNFHSKKGAYKLMMTKKANSGKIDMLYNIDEDPYEMNNLIGNNGMTASDYTVGKAEHLKALLIDWMLRFDGEDKIYSNPKWNNYEGNGDIEEIRNRRGWRTLDLWVCDTLIHFGNVVDVNGKLTRNEWIYVGRTTPGTTNISGITLEGSDAGLFTVSEFTSGAINTNEYKKIKVQFTPTTLDYIVADAKLRIKHDAGADIVIDLVSGERNTSGNTVIDDCDELTDWSGENTLSLNSNHHQQGRSCIEVNGNAIIDFQKVFSSPVNTGADDSEAKLQMWYYVSDVSLLADENLVELGSGGAADVDEYSWKINKADLHNGWNFVSLNFSDATVTGSPDINAISWFRLTRKKTGDLLSRIDYIQVATDEMPKPGMPAAVFPKDGSGGNDVNVALDWIAGENALEHEIYFGKTDPPVYVATQSDNSYRLENLDDNTTYYWQIKERNSDGTSVGEVWSFQTMGPPGANYNGLPADGSTGISNTISLKWIAGNYAKTHNVYFGTTNPPLFVKNQVGTSYTPDEPLDFETTYYWRADAVNDVDTTAGKIYSFTTCARDASGMIVLDDCDSRSGWGGSNLEGVNSTDQKQGDGCLYARGSATNDFQRTFDPAVNTGVAEADAKLVFWYYISDVSQLDSKGQFELGSGNKADIDEWNWQIDVSTLQKGWNKIELDITDAGSTGTPSLSKINWFRIYRQKLGEVETRIDYIHIIDKTVTPKAPEKAENPYPANESSNVSLSPKLTWTEGLGTLSHNLYFGTEDPLELVGNQFSNSYQLSDLDSSTVYFWRIDEVNEVDTTKGDVWTFTTIESEAVNNEVIHNSNFKISPNPSFGVIYLETDIFEDPYSISVYNLSGRLVHHEELAVAKTHLNLTNLDKGTYILEVRTKINRSTAKIILE